MNAQVVSTVEAILERTRPEDATDFRAWGEAAALAVEAEPAVAHAVIAAAMAARARQRGAREFARTASGMALWIAISAWPWWTDAGLVRRTGVRLAAEGAKKAKLGQRMQQAADCMDAHPGLSARDAWAAQGLDAADLAAAEDAA